MPASWLGTDWGRYVPKRARRSMTRIVSRRSGHVADGEVGGLRQSRGEGRGICRRSRSREQLRWGRQKLLRRMLRILLDSKDKTLRAMTSGSSIKASRLRALFRFAVGRCWFAGTVVANFTTPRWSAADLDVSPFCGLLFLSTRLDINDRSFESATSFPASLLRRSRARRWSRQASRV